MFKDFKYELPELKMFLKKISCYTNLPSLGGNFRKMEAERAKTAVHVSHPSHLLHLHPLLFYSLFIQNVFMVKSEAFASSVI